MALSFLFQSAPNVATIFTSTLHNILFELSGSLAGCGDLPQPTVGKRGTKQTKEETM